VIAQINIFCIDEDNFIKSVTENWVLQKRLWPALASLHPLLSSDFFSARNLFLWKTKKISSSRGERISFAEEMDFFCERAPSLAVAVSPLGASVKITASLRFLAVAAAAFLSWLTACRRISPESGKSSSERPPHPGQCTALPLMSARCSHQSCPPLR